MSATLVAGPASLLLNVVTPLDTDGTTPRDDVAGLMVWYSTTSATFDPNAGEGTLAYNGTGLSITLSALTPGTLHHVKYAIISSIDPSVRDISSVLSATPTSAALSIDISGYVSFTQAIDGTNTPSATTLTASQINIVNPAYAWAVTGGTPSSGTGASITITPLSTATSVSVTLTVTGTNTPVGGLVKTITMPIVYNGQRGQTGTPGNQVAYPTIYRWTTSSTPPTRPTTTSTYIWSSASFTAPTDWTSQPTGSTTPGSYMWTITIPLATSASVTESTLDWTLTANPIRAQAYIGTNGVIGSSPLIYDIVTSTPVITKDAVDAATAGTYSSLTIQGKKYDGNVTTNYGWVTVTANGDTEATTASDTASAPVSLAPATTAGKSSYTIKMYNQATVSGATLLDTQTIYVVYKGSMGYTGLPGAAAITASVSNDTCVFSASTTGAVASYANSGTEIRVYEGATQLNYDGTGTANSTWKVTAASTNITVGTITDSGTYATVGVHSGVADDIDTSLITYTITGKNSLGTAFTITKTQTFSKSKTGNTGGTGSPGSANFVITRVANDNSAPTAAEVVDAIGRAAIAGDIAVVSYNNYNGAVNYKYTTGWTLFSTYMPGSLIVDGTITASKMITGLMSADNVLTRGLTVRNAAGTVILGAGTALDFSNVGGTTKPADNATVGADWSSNVTNAPRDSTNMVTTPSFSSTALGTWSAGTVKAITGKTWPYALAPAQRDITQTGKPIPVIAGETLYVSATLNTDSALYDLSFGGQFFDKNGTTVTWLAGVSLAAFQAWTTKNGSMTVPATAVTFVPWIQINSMSNFAAGYYYITNMYIGRAERGATYGADWTTNVAGASTVNTSISNAATAASNAATAATTASTAAAAAKTAVASKIDKSTADTLAAVLSVDTTVAAGIKVGDLTWDAAGKRTGGKGVALTPAGLVGYNSLGTNTFIISAATGDATFSGTLDVASAASGARMEIKNETIKVYDASGTVRVIIGKIS